MNYHASVWPLEVTHHNAGNLQCGRWSPATAGGTPSTSFTTYKASSHPNGCRHIFLVTMTRLFLRAIHARNFHSIMVLCLLESPSSQLERPHRGVGVHPPNLPDGGWG